jgi:hypothetical protein
MTTQKTINLPPELQEIVDMKADYEKKVQAAGKKAIKAVFKDLFDKFPEVHAVRWSQYTPYFNDGDACHFGLGEFWFGIHQEQSHNLSPDEEFEDSEEEGEISYVSNFSKYDYKTGVTSYASQRHKELEDALNSVETTCDSLQDVLEAVFGDHVKVTVTRRKIDIDDYDHD